MFKVILSGTLISIVILTFSPSIAGAASITRYAIVVGNNVGTDQADPLKYAERDARRMAKLLREIGGASMENLHVLEGRDPDALRDVFDLVSEKIANAKEDAVFLFYYSGHADTGWLRMNGKGISVGEIRRRLEQVPAKVRVAIVDACQSGAITRSKGGVVVSPFLDEASVKVEGLVILTSASAAEPAQESDILMSSYFSHHLMSGMRGPADINNDGRVSAVEAYDHAYKYTVMETEGTVAGAQHPTFLYALQGEGDIALTSIAEGRARIELPEMTEGTFFFIGAGDQIEAEVVKYPGKTAKVVLAPGVYEVRWRSGDTRRIATVNLIDGDVVSLAVLTFKEQKIVVSTEKGRKKVKIAASLDETPQPLENYPLGGGSSWAAGASPNTKRESLPTEQKPVGEGETSSSFDESKSFAKRSDAHLRPGMSLLSSMFIPGFAQGAEGRTGAAAFFTGLFAATAAGGSLVGLSLDEAGPGEARTIKLTGATLLSYLAFYTYAYAAIDGFYATTKGGAGKPDLSKMKFDFATNVSSALIRTDNSMEMGFSGGLGLGIVIHPNLVVGLRNVAAFRQTGIWNISFGPELRLRSMWLDQLGWSLSAGAVINSSLRYNHNLTEGAEDINIQEAAWSVLPYLAARVHFFPARSWSLDFGIRSGVAVGKRPLVQLVSQESGSFIVEYLGGLTWYY